MKSKRETEKNEAKSKKVVKNTKSDFAENMVWKFILKANCLKFSIEDKTT